MKAACNDVLAAYAFGAAFEALFKDLDDDMAVPAYPELPFFQGPPQPQPQQPASAANTTTTVALPIHLEPPPPTCTRSPYSCCCGMGEDQSAAADAGGSGSHGGGDSEDAFSTATWGTLEDELHPAKGPHLPSIPERPDSCCSCASIAAAGGATGDKSKGKTAGDEAPTEPKRTLSFNLARMEAVRSWARGFVPRRPRKPKQAKAE